MSLLVGAIPAPCIDASAAYFSARAEDCSAGEGAQFDSDETVSGDGWIYRICADGYAEVLGHTDAAAENLSIPYSLGGAWVVRIGEDAFADNAALSAIFIPGSVTDIPESAFPGHTALTVRAYNGSDALAFARSQGFAEENLSEYDFFDDVIDLTELKSAQWSFQGSASIRIGDPWARRIGVGTKMFIPPCRKYEKGMPVHVESISNDNSFITFSELAFGEAVESYHVENLQMYPVYDQTVFLNDGIDMESSGVATYSNGASFSESKPRRFSISYEIADGVTVSGSITWGSSVTTSVDYEWMQLKSLTVSETDKTELKLSIVGKVDDKQPANKSPYKIDLFKVPFVSSGLVSLCAKVSLNVSVSGEISISTSYETTEKIIVVGKNVSHTKSKKTNFVELSAAAKTEILVKASVTLTLGFETSAFGFKIGLAIDIAEFGLATGIETSISSTYSLSEETITDATVSSKVCFDVAIDFVFKITVRAGILNTEVSNGDHGRLKFSFERDILNYKALLKLLHWEGSLGKWVTECAGSNKKHVYFFTGTDSTIPSQLVDAGERIQRPADPVRSNHTFDGWYTDTSCTHPWDFDNDTVSGDVFLYAKWINPDGEVESYPGESTDSTEITPEEAASLEYLEYSIDTENQCVTITGFVGKPTELIIPRYIESMPVTSIGLKAFFGSSSLTSITIPDSVTYIGSYAFYRCRSLKSITIPGSVTCINYNAFMGCSSLTSITIPDSVTDISCAVFSGCSSLTSITIPDSVTYIGGHEFKDCSSLTSITIPDSVTSIDGRAFENCSSLTGVRIHNGVTSIGDYAFNNCYDLTCITIPDGVEYIGVCTFQRCSSLTNIIIPDSVTFIAVGAFSGCSSLTSVTISDSVTSIYDDTFRDCSRLTSVTIPDSVTSIEDYAFYNCYGLTSITIPDSVTSFGTYVFAKCPALKYLYTEKGSAAETYFTENYPNVTILYLNGDSHLLSFNSNGGTGVESRYVSTGSKLWKPDNPVRANYSFTGWYRDAACTQAWNFATDAMPDGNLTLYAGWSYLPSGFVYDVRDGAATITAYTGDEIYLNVPAALGGVPVKALAAGCIGSGVRRIAIPETVSSVDAQAFRWATSLHTITVAEGNPNYYAVDGVLYASDGTLLCYPRAKRADSFTPAAGTVAIGDCAFYAADGLGALALPDGLVSIGSRAIYGCDRLTSLTIPASVAVLGDYALYGCGALERIDFAADPVEIGSGCFIGCGDDLAMFGPTDAVNLAEYADAYLLSYNEYLITYMMYGEVLAYASARAGARLGMPPKPEDGELSFKGWSLKEDGALWDYETEVMPAHEITLHAIWQYDFSYEAADGGVKLLKYTGDKRSIRVPGTVDGNAVVGVADGCFDGLTGISLVAERGSIAESYADAKGIPFEALAHTLRFESNGGTYVPPRTLYATDAIEVPLTMRTNYNLLGWYADAACTQAWDFSDGMPEEDLTLYALWEKIDESVADMDFEFSTAEDGLTITAYTGRRTAVAIPEEINGVPVVAIAAHAFDGNQVMFRVTIPGSVRHIGNAAFASSRVSALVLERGVAEIGAHAFDSCYELQSIDLPDTVASIGAYAFQDCGSLLRLSLPEQLTAIPEGMLAGCGNLASLSLPSALEAIGASAFEGCNALRTLALGQAVSDVQLSAFNGCGNLKELQVTDTNMYYRSVDGVLLSADGSTLLCYPQGKTDSTYAIPASVTAIGEGAMANSRIQSLTLNDRLAYIEGNAVRNSRYLSEVAFPASGNLSDIGESAFRDCGALKALDLPASLEYIEDKAFDGCGLTSVRFSGDPMLGSDAIPANPGLTFYGNRGYDAEYYAEYYGIRFVDLSVDVPVTGIAIETALSMMTGGKAQLSVAYTPKNTTEREIQWSSSDASVVAVNAEGILSARYEGTAVISAKAKDGSVASCTVTVVKPKMQKIALSDVQVVLMLRNEFTLTATLPGDDSGTIVTWVSTNPQVASVEDGVICPHHTGSVAIIATAPGYEQAVCQVDVIAPTKLEGGLLLPQALTQIDAEAFMGGAFEAVILPEGTLYIGERAFADCTLLRQIQIPASVESIAEDAFEGYNDLIIFCPLGSAAEAYAIAHRISCAAE